MGTIPTHNRILLPRYAQRGVSLVECLATILVLSIGLVGAVQCISSSLALNLRANRVALATALAEKTQEDVYNYLPAGYVQHKQIEMEDNTNITITTPATDTTVVTERVALNGGTTGSSDEETLPGCTVTVRIEPCSDASNPSMNNKAKLVTVTVRWKGGTQNEFITLATIVNNKTTI